MRKSTEFKKYAIYHSNYQKKLININIQNINNIENEKYQDHTYAKSLSESLY